MLEFTTLKTDIKVDMETSIRQSIRVIFKFLLMILNKNLKNHDTAELTKNYEPNNGISFFQEKSILSMYI